jgi:uncharacterized RDD family membrane protein YckC
VSPKPHDPRATALQGRRAGLVSRLLALAIDLVTIVLLEVLLLIVIAGIRALFTDEFTLELSSDAVNGPIAVVIAVAFMTYGWGLNGRTVGKVALGLRVVRTDGRDLSPARALARAVLYLVFLPGILWAAVSRKNASIQDLIIRTAVVYDWGPAAAPHPVQRDAG